MRLMSHSSSDKAGAEAEAEEEEEEAEAEAEAAEEAAEAAAEAAVEAEWRKTASCSRACASMPVPMQHEKYSLGWLQPLVPSWMPASLFLTPVPSG